MSSPFGWASFASVAPAAGTPSRSRQRSKWANFIGSRDVSVLWRRSFQTVRDCGLVARRACMQSPCQGKSLPARPGLFIGVWSSQRKRK